ncbi:MAG: AraC family transcriptional regulator [Verrucomicrobia bacterium]|nr:AraC family transcriptional regulator [Verrucomicrobiota bacterium]
MYPEGFSSRWLGTNGDSEHESRCVSVLILMEGHARVVWSTGRHCDITPNQLIWLNTDIAPSRWQILPSALPQALALRFPIDWVHASLGSLRQELSADFQALLLGPYPPTPIITRTLEAEDRVWARTLMAPTLCSGARLLMEGSRMSEFFFRKVLTESRGEELLCTRTRRQSLERVTIVRAALLSDLENPPPLDDLAELCGCHPQYLSRTFSDTAGTTISLYLRRLRIERAADLISTGRMNASEAALEVGYRSLSHFSQAFRAEKGKSPSVWMKANR